MRFCHNYVDFRDFFSTFASQYTQNTLNINNHPKKQKNATNTSYNKESADY